MLSPPSPPPPLWAVLAGGSALALALALLQVALWWRRPQVTLASSPLGRRVLRVLPWRLLPNLASRAAAAYGRASAREPRLALGLGAACAVLACAGCACLRLGPAVGALHAARGQLPASSALAAHAARSRVAFGLPADELLVLATARGGTSILGGGALHPLLAIHNAVVGAQAGRPVGLPAGAAAGGGASAGYGRVCQRRALGGAVDDLASWSAPDGDSRAGSGLGGRAGCALTSLLAIAAPSASELSSDGHIDGTDAAWVPSVPGGADSPYEERVRELLSEAAQVGCM